MAGWRGGRGARARAGLVAGAVLAVAAGWSPPSAGASLSGEQVVVTAKRKPQNLGTLAGNTARLEQPVIERVRAEHPSELLNRLPGVLIHRNSGQEHLTAIRSPVLTAGAGAGSFLFLEDGVPLRAAGFANVNGLFEAHYELAGAIEVVRGPGSAYYGSNAVHGLVNVISRRPGSGPVFTADVSGGSFGRVNGSAVASRAAGRHGLLAGLTLAHEGGFRDDASVDSQKLTLRHDWAGGPVSVSTRFTAINLNQETAGFVQGPDAYKHTVFVRANPNPEAFRDAQAVRLSSRVDLAAAGGRLSLTPFARWTDMAFLLHFLPSRALEKNSHWSAGLLATQEWDLAGGHSLAIGFDGEYTEGALDEFQARPSFGTFPQGTHYDYTVRALVLAPYVHAEWQLAPAWRATTGLRVEYARYGYDNLTQSDTVGRFRRPADRTDDYWAVSPKLGLTYAYGRDRTLYLAYARGARAPQTTDLYRLQARQVPGDIETETLDNIELGLRGSLGAARYELAAFAQWKRNFFFRDSDGFNVPDGRTRHRGVEGALAVALSPRLDATLSATYARHTYAFSRPVSLDVSESIREGDDIDSAPRILVNAGLLWRPNDDTEIELEWVHVGRYFTDAANAHAYPGHDVFNLRASWQIDARWTLFGAVRNLTNTDYAERADFAFGTERYFPGEDRHVEIGLRVAF